MRPKTLVTSYHLLRNDIHFLVFQVDDLHSTQQRVPTLCAWRATNY